MIEGELRASVGWADLPHRPRVELLSGQARWHYLRHKAYFRDWNIAMLDWNVAVSHWNVTIADCSIAAP
jgi:hypothetical protein